jgi:glutamate-ammonia-ligase adenylyltransferase
MTSRLSAYGRLYEVDARLRPTGRSGSLATSLAEFSRYYAEGGGQLWERQALCKARVVYGSPRAAKAAEHAVAKAAFDHPWRPSHADEIRAMRQKLEKSAAAGDLKRGPGGIVDIEFLVQMLQLKHGRRNAKIRPPNTLLALAALRDAEYLAAEDYELFDANYRLLRTIESRMRLINSTARDKLPDDPTELAKLAHLLRYPDGEALLADYEQATQNTRRLFDQQMDAAGTQG